MNKAALTTSTLLLFLTTATPLCAMLGGLDGWTERFEEQQRIFRRREIARQNNIRLGLFIATGTVILLTTKSLNEHTATKVPAESPTKYNSPVAKTTPTQK